MNYKRDKIIVRLFFRVIGLLVIAVNLIILSFYIKGNDIEVMQILSVSSFSLLYQLLFGLVLYITITVVIGSSCLLGYVPFWILKITPKSVKDILLLKL
ncbi:MULTISPECIES: hypothetical protein [unclassified Pseudoalteromonas]|uniref:hypothetical protein n=1 Tax=unclassified Pseudoalteromonas TaxID=194690 RepID=UPI0005A99611|nr:MULTISPECIES: hypothetical protein [unclassified Pseudoalteromonas]